MKTDEDIKIQIDRFMAGETSIEDEARLAEYFRTNYDPIRRCLPISIAGCRIRILTADVCVPICSQWLLQFLSYYC